MLKKNLFLLELIAIVILVCSQNLSSQTLINGKTLPGKTIEAKEIAAKEMGIPGTAAILTVPTIPPPVEKVAEILEGAAVVEQDGTLPQNAPALTQSFPALNLQELLNLNISPNNPPDPHLATGIHHIAMVVNSAFAVYDKATGNRLLLTALKTWFNSVQPPPPDPDFIYDPRIIFDHYANRWVLIAVSRKNNTHESAYLISVSQTPDPMGAWWIYSVDATVNVQNSTVYESDNWADFPALGYSGEVVLLTSNQFTFTLQFEYARIRILKKSELYSGASLTLYDFWDLEDADGEKSFTIQPAHHFSDPASVYLANNKRLGSSQEGGEFTRWRIDSPTGITPSIHKSTLNIAPYQAEHIAPQHGITHTLDITDARFQNLVYRDGFLYSTFTEKHDFGSGERSAIRYLKFNATSSAVSFDVTYGKQDQWYFFPAVYVDGSGNMGLVFNNSGMNIYPGARYTVRMSAESEARNSSTLQAGSTILNILTARDERYGDYSGIALDPLNYYKFWFCGEYVIDSQTWGTYIGSIVTNTATEPVTLTNEIDNGNAGGELLVKRTGNNTSLIPSGETIHLLRNSNVTIRTQNERLPIGVLSHKHHDWNDNVSEFRLEHDITIVTQTEDDAVFLDIDPVSVTTYLISANTQDLGQIDFRDPWLVEADGSQPDNFHTFTVLPFTPGSGNYGNYGGVFLDQDPAQTPVYYSARVPFYQILNINGEDITWNFAGWEGSGAQVTMPDNFINGYFETPVVFQSPNAILTARYKGYLRTSLPGNGNSKNQRRVLAAPEGNWQEGTWNMVYEDAGDIWLAWSVDDAVSWEEVADNGYDPPGLARINFNRGQASNPTLSNIFAFSGNPNDYNRYVIAWTERNSSGEMEIHLQTMRLGYPYYGWGNSSNWDREASHRVIDVTPAPDARPVVQLHQEEDNVILTLSFEVAEGGPISLGYIEFAGNGSNSVEDLDEATEYQESWWLCLYGLQSGCQYPVLLKQEAVYGQDATTFLYFVEPQEDGFSSKIVQFDLSTCEIEYLDRPEDYLTYHSLQGVISQGNAMIGIAAFYKKYPNDSCPQLNNVITSMDKPTIMAENSSGYASLIGEIMMRSVRGNWYRWPGYGNPAYLGNQAAGIYTRAVVDEDDRAAMVTRINSTPAKLELYSGSGIFDEEEGGIQTDIRLFHSWEGENNRRVKSLLDFSGADIELPDSLITGRYLAAVKLLNPSPENIIARQPDTLAVPIGVDVLRNGQTVYSFPPRPWTTLNMSYLPGIELGDILKFKLERPLLFRKGYAEISLREENRQKIAGEEKIADVPLPAEISLDIFPNPFNPATTFKIALPQPAHVRLEVFNVLGQRVETVVNEYLQAGYREIRFDASSLSSGIYIYRFKTPEKVQTGRMLLLK